MNKTLRVVGIGCVGATVMCTSCINLSIDQYQGQWKVEDKAAVTKPEPQGPPARLKASFELAQLELLADGNCVITSKDGKIVAGRWHRVSEGITVESQSWSLRGKGFLRGSGDLVFECTVVELLKDIPVPLSTTVVLNRINRNTTP